MRVRPYTDADAERWDRIAQSSPFGTFQHTRHFLSYHGKRFKDRSVVCEDEAGRLLAVFPAALKLDDPHCVVSHPGATYGGLLCHGETWASDITDMLTLIAAHYRAAGVGRIEYRSVPVHLHAPLAQSDQYALWRLGATLIRRDLWNVLALPGRPSYSVHHRRSLARAVKAGVVVSTAGTEDAYQTFHAILAENLGERHGVVPAHSVAEMLLLRDRFPGKIALWLARDAGGRCIAGSWVFAFGPRAWHTQYIASTAAGREQHATHLLMDAIIRAAEGEGVSSISFGASTEDGGRRLNAGLFRFKAGFGAGAACQDIYRLQLN